MPQDLSIRPVTAYFIFLIVVFLLPAATAQQRRDVYVDRNGVMRWGGTNEEVHGFGVNYTVPFAHAYRSAKKLNVDHERAIDDDVYHFARLGFDAFRVHVWDTEISDSTGNLLANEHLRLFDYALMQMKQRGIKLLITPIAYWGNGYPDPDEKTPGFSAKYGKEDCLTNEEAIRAQERYLHQFLNHVNSYTNVAYKDDPDIVAFEISNEPHHQGSPEEVTRFINRMVNAMRKTGTKKPIFYNVSHSIHLHKAYFDARIQGGTFQWYPTGLGAAHELRGNFLPNVDRYPIPFADNPKFKKAAKIVYEFDAADVGRSYIYPAMARSFREAGIQWATHFAYDPTYMAHANTEYNTHFMNLVYTPGKALSLKIASEVFHEVPMYKNFGRYPDNTTFDSFRVDYEQDLAEMNSGKKFIHTNHTSTKPANPEVLEEVAGVGNSPLIRYEGTGAYFLDKVSDGVWRLEVMPDAIWIDNPFGRNNLEKKVAVINWRSWPMTISLPGLGEKFSIRQIDQPGKTQESHDATVQISPGTWLIAKDGLGELPPPDEKFRNIRLAEFAAPPSTVDATYVLHTPDRAVVADNPYRVLATIVSRDMPDSVTILAGSGWRTTRVPMKHRGGYTFETDVPKELIREGYFNYTIEVAIAGLRETFPTTGPGVLNRRPGYRTAVLPAARKLFIFNAYEDGDQVSRVWRPGSGLIPTGEPSRAELVTHVDRLFIPDPENKEGKPIHDYSMRFNFRPRIGSDPDQLDKFNVIFIKGRSLKETALKLQVAFITRTGATAGAIIELPANSSVVSLDKNALRPVDMVILPRPYPTFLPYYFHNESAFHWADVETIQISAGPGLSDEDKKAGVSFAIESIWIE